MKSCAVGKEFFFKIAFTSWALVAHTFNSHTGEAEASDLFKFQPGQQAEFQDSQDYI